MQTAIGALLGAAAVLFGGQGQPVVKQPVVRIEEAVVIAQAFPQMSIWEALGERMDGRHGGECVEFIQRLFESYYTDPGFRGHASAIVPNSDVPEVGSAVLERGRIGHAALVTEVTNKEIVVVESNWKMDGMIAYGRRIAIGSKGIRGYYKFKNPIPDETKVR